MSQPPHLPDHHIINYLSSLVAMDHDVIVVLCQTLTDKDSIRHTCICDVVPLAMVTSGDTGTVDTVVICVTITVTVDTGGSDIMIIRHEYGQLRCWVL